MDVSELDRLIASTLAEIDAVLVNAKEEGRELTPEETTSVEEKTEAVETYEASKAEKIRQQEALDRLARAKARFTERPKERGEPPKVGTPTVDLVRDSILDDPNAGFRHFGEFASAVAWAARNPRVDERLLKYQAATGLSQGVAAEGGFTVPPAYARSIWSEVNLDDGRNLMAMCDQYTVEGASLTFTANAETNRTAGNRFGGVRGYWLAEAGQITSSKPTVRQVKLEPQELGVLIYVTNKLLRNEQMALSQYLTRAATEEIRFLVNDAIVNGTGSGMPKGFTTTGCKIEVSKETGQPATTIVAENIDKMWARLLPQSQGRAVWFINVDCQPELDNLNRAVGVGGSLVYSPPGGLADRPFATLKGRPVVPIEFCQTLGTAGDIILADMNMYALGTRGGVDTATSIHLKFDYNETAFRFMFEVDGQPWLASAITPFLGSNTLSPFITLAARS